MSAAFFELQKLHKENEKIFYCFSDGFFKKEDGQRYLDALTEELGAIDTTEYILLINTRNEKPTEGDALPVLVKCHEVFHKTPFKEKYFVETKSVTNYIQKLRTDEFGLYEELKLIKDPSEILNR